MIAYTCNQVEAIRPDTIEAKTMIKHPETGEKMTINELDEWLDVEIKETSNDEETEFSFILVNPDK